MCEDASRGGACKLAHTHRGELFLELLDHAAHHRCILRGPLAHHAQPGASQRHLGTTFSHSSARELRASMPACAAGHGRPLCTLRAWSKHGRWVSAAAPAGRLTRPAASLAGMPAPLSRKQDAMAGTAATVSPRIMLFAAWRVHSMVVTLKPRGQPREGSKKQKSAAGRKLIRVRCQQCPQSQQQAVIGAELAARSSGRRCLPPNRCFRRFCRRSRQ